MNWEELSTGFSWEQLCNFEWGQLSLSKYELLTKSEYGSIDLPSNIQTQLRSLCPEIISQYPNRKTLPEFLGTTTVRDFIILLWTAAQLYNFAEQQGIIEKFTYLCQLINDFLLSKM